MSEKDDGGVDREGIFDWLWDTDTKLGREASREMEEAYKNGDLRVES